MCYTGICRYESYPHGFNEGCHCTMPIDGECPDIDNPHSPYEEFYDPQYDDIITGVRGRRGGIDD